MPNIKVNDISMYYEIHGQGEPLIFIAGFGVDHTTWSEVVPQFETDYQVILFDNRGAGQTDVPQGAYSIKDMVNDVVSLCGALHIDKAHFVGNSMGGFILQQLAFNYPNLVKSATISHAPMFIYTPFHLYLTAQLELIKAQAPFVSLIKAICSWIFSYQFLSKPGVLEELIKLGLENPYPFTVQGYEGQYAALANFDSRDWASQIKVPTFVLTSDQDLVFNPASVRLLAEHIPNSSYYCFDHCGHAPHIEYPEKYTQLIKDFICNNAT